MNSETQNNCSLPTKGIADTAKMINDNQLLAADLINATLKSIDNNLDLNAVLWRDDKAALARADQCDKGEAKGVLCGIPIIIKDNVDVKGMPVCCGSLAFKNKKAAKNAVIVDRLLKEGAVIVGKSNMDEFAMGSSNTTSGFGRVLNPLDKSRVPGGSSGGSTAAVAADLCFAAIGSDTGGSIRQPASYCGVVGLKPTHGSISEEGCFPLAPSMDQMGPIAKNISDCALIFGVINNQGIDGYLDIKPTVGRVAIIKEAFDIAEELKNSFDESQNDKNGVCDVADVLNDAIEHLKQCGCEVSTVSVPSFRQAHLIYKILAYGEIALAMQSVQDGRELLGREVKKRIALGHSALNDTMALAKAERLREELTLQMDNALKDADILILPTAPSTAFSFMDKPSLKEIEFSDMFTQPASIAGLPSLSVPYGKSKNGLPLGIQLVGRLNGEKTVFSFAKTLVGEQ